MGNQIGAHGNAFNGAVGAGASSNVIDTLDCPFVHIFGNASGATNIDVMVSMDEQNWYKHTTIAVASAGDFSQVYTFGPTHVKLVSSASVTIVATICAKS